MERIHTEEVSLSRRLWRNIVVNPVGPEVDFQDVEFGFFCDYMHAFVLRQNIQDGLARKCRGLGRQHLLSRDVMDPQTGVSKVRSLTGDFDMAQERRYFKIIAQELAVMLKTQEGIVGLSSYLDWLVCFGGLDETSI